MAFRRRRRSFRGGGRRRFGRRGSVGRRMRRRGVGPIRIGIRR